MPDLNVNSIGPASGSTVTITGLAAPSSGIIGIDITHPTYGADPTGVVDATSAINAALKVAGGSSVAAIKSAATSVPSASGGVSEFNASTGVSGGAVFLPRGLFKISGPIYVPAGCWLFGTGDGSVLVHQGAGNAIEFTRPSTDGYSFRSILQNFRIEANNNGSSQHGIYAQYVHTAVLDHVVVKHCGGNGIYLNDHTVGIELRGVHSIDNALAQLFCDGLASGAYRNSDSHVLLAGNYWCNTTGTQCVRLRATLDIKAYGVLLDGISTGTGLQLEGTVGTQWFGGFNENQGTHLSVNKETTTGTRNLKTLIVGGEWEGGTLDHMNVTVDNADETELNHIRWNVPPANVNQSTITVGAGARDMIVRGRCELMALNDLGKNTRLTDDVTEARGWDGAPIANTNLVGFGSDLTAGSWVAGSGIASRTVGGAGPVPGVPSTRVVAGTGGGNNYCQYPTASSSLGVMHSVAFWAKQFSGSSYLNVRISVPGIGDELDQPVSLGPSWKRYIVLGPVGVLTGNVAVTFVLPNSATADIAGVKVEQGSPTPYIHTQQGATQSGQAGDEFPLGRIIRRVANLTDAATVNIDAAAGDYFILKAAGSRTIAAPTNTAIGAWFKVDLLNNTGGAITTTWNAAFKLSGGAWTDPATAKRRIVEFIYDGTNWIEQSRSPSDL